MTIYVYDDNLEDLKSTTLIKYSYVSICQLKPPFRIIHTGNGRSVTTLHQYQSKLDLLSKIGKYRLHIILVSRSGKCRLQIISRFGESRLIIYRLDEPRLRIYNISRFDESKLLILYQTS